MNSHHDSPSEDGRGCLERAANEKLKQQIVEKLEKKKKEVEQMAIYKYLAENDNEAASLFEQLKQLSK